MDNQSILCLQIELDSEEKIEIWAYTTCWWKMVINTLISKAIGTLAFGLFDHHLDVGSLPAGSLLVSGVVCQMHFKKISHVYLHSCPCSVSLHHYYWPASTL